MVRGGRPLVGAIDMPGDKSVSLRALVLGALAQGTTVVHNASTGHDTAALETALVALGVKVERAGTTVRVGGGLRERPGGVRVDLDRSPTAVRLLSGAIAGSEGMVALELNESVDQSFDPLAATLERVGVPAVSGHRNGCPAVVVDGGVVSAGTVRPAVVSAQLKSVLLLAGTQLARGRLTVTEERPTRNHTEEMLPVFGADVEIVDEVTTSVGPSPLQAAELTIPGDPSHAAYWMVAAVTVPGSDITVRGVHTGARRAAYLEVLHRMGADLTVGADGTTVRAEHGAVLRGVEIDVAQVPAVLDELPILALAAALAEGTTSVRGVRSVRTGPANRVAHTLDLLTKLGVDVAGDDDVWTITGRPGGLEVPSNLAWHGDHHLGFMAAVAAATTASGSYVPHFARASAAYPEFPSHLESLES